MHFVISKAFVLLMLTAGLPAQEKASIPSPIVFFDIAGPKIDQLRTFYADLFGWKSGATGQLTIPIVAPIPSAFRQDPAEKRVYIGVENVAKKLQEIKQNGGTIDAMRFEVPGVAVLGLFKDPAGNPMGLVEMENGKPKIP